jgi:uncharacterized membrane protein
MLGRTAVLVLAGSIGLGAPTAALAANEKAYAREEDVYVVAAVDDDDGDGDTGNTGNSGDTSKTSGQDSNDNTNSRNSAVSKDRDRSKGDLTKDRTNDGPGSTRDNTRNHTNDKSRNDTR